MRNPRTLLRTLAVLSVLVGGPVATSGTAVALSGYGHRFIPSASNPFNGSDNPNFPGGFNDAHGVAVNNSTNPSDPSAGDLYVVDDGDVCAPADDAAGSCNSSRRSYL